mgnify:CR=1 FL=1
MYELNSSEVPLSAETTSPRFGAMLSIDLLSFDLYEGTIIDPADTRIIFLATDILRGIHAALAYEAGDAWRIVLYRCGFLWGQKTLQQFVRQSQGAFGTKFEFISADAFLSNFVAAIAANGWGVLSFDLSKLVSNGVLRFELRKSLFSEALEHLRDRVDYLVAGMLAGIFSDLSRQDLSCVEITSELTGASASVFLVSARARIESIQASVESGATERELLEVLCG